MSRMVAEIRRDQRLNLDSGIFNDDLMQPLARGRIKPGGGHRSKPERWPSCRTRTWRARAIRTRRPWRCRRTRRCRSQYAARELLRIIREELRSKLRKRRFLRAEAIGGWLCQGLSSYRLPSAGSGT